jgi:hypothetical protein
VGERLDPRDGIRRESALVRLRRYREQASLSLGLMREVEDAAHKFSRRLFGGLDLVAALVREVGFAVEVARDGRPSYSE